VSRQARAFLMLLPAALLAVTAVVLLVLPFFRDEAPGPDDWLEAARLVREGWQDRDAVRIEPSWMTGGRVYFGDLDGGPRTPLRILDVHRTLEPGFLYRFKRVWLVAALDAADRGDLPILPGASLVRTIPLGRLSVFLYALPEDVLTWSLQSTRAARGNAPVRKAGLPGHAALRQVAGGPRSCTVLEPRKGRSVLTAEVPGPGTLFVTAGNTLEAARSKEGKDVEASIRLNGTEVAGVRIPKRDYSLSRFRFDLQHAGPAALEIAVSSSDPAKREVCVDAYVLSSSVAASLEDPE